MFNKKDAYCSPEVVSVYSAVCEGIICNSIEGVDNYTVEEFDWEHNS